MIEKGKISSGQMSILLYPVVVSTGDLLLPAITAKVAGRDLWLSPIWSALVAWLVLLIFYLLHKQHPQLSLIQYCERLLGKAAGKAVGLLYLYFFLYIGSGSIRQYGEFVVGKFLSTTPMIVVFGSMVFVCGLAARGGIEVLARAAQIFAPLVICCWLLVIVLITPDLHPVNMLPVLDEGIAPSLKASFMLQPWFNNVMLSSMIFPLLTDREKSMKWGSISICGMMVTLAVLDLVALFLFGPVTAYLTYPLMEAARYIVIADFLEHLESVIMAIWVASAFIKIVVYYYALSLGCAQWLKLSDYRPLVFPLGLILVVFSIWLGRNLFEITHFFQTTNSFYNLTMTVLLPTVLLLISTIRAKLRADKEESFG